VNGCILQQAVGRLRIDDRDAASRLTGCESICRKDHFDQIIEAPHGNNANFKEPSLSSATTLVALPASLPPRGLVFRAENGF